MQPLVMQMLRSVTGQATLLPHHAQQTGHFVVS